MPTEIVVVKIEKDITPQNMIKNVLKENMTDFLQMPNKLFSKKRKQINKSKQKTSIRKSSSRKTTISSLDSSNKKELPVSISAIKKSDSKSQDIDIAMIGTDAYCTACCLKKVQVFALSMRDIQYQAKKEAKAETDLKSVVSQKYHDFLNVFSKKNSDTFFTYWKYDYKIYLKEKQNSNYAPLYKISFKELNTIK